MNLKNQIKFNHISYEDGLSESVVFCIVQDSYGFMWFGTQDGLNRYDGYKFRVYKNDNERPDSISDNSIRCLVEDKNKNLWIGTENGLNKYDRENDCFRNFKFESDPFKSNINNDIRKIVEDDSGNLWIGTYGGGLLYFDTHRNEFSSMSEGKDVSTGLRDNRIIDIIYDSNGNLLIGTWGGGLNLYDTANDKFEHVILTGDESSNISIMRINALYEDKRGTLWAATNFGLYCRKKDADDFISFNYDPSNSLSISSDLVSQVFEDSSGNLWVGTRDRGLNLLDRDSGEFACYEHVMGSSTCISHNSVYSICEDMSGILWIGTFGGGLSKFNNTIKRIGHYFFDEKNPNSLLSNTIFGFCEDEAGNLWIGTQDKGMSRLNRIENRIEHFVHDPDDDASISEYAITSMIRGDNGTIWIASLGDGLNKFDPQTGKFYHYRNVLTENNTTTHNTIYSIAMDGSGILWLGTGGGGLSRYDPVKNEFRIYANDPEDKYSISSNRVRTIFIDSEETIWLGTDKGGLNKFDKKEEKFYAYKNNPDDPASLGNNNVLSICEGRSGILWIGTSSGLNRFDRNSGSFKRYGKKDGLCNDIVNGMLEDDDGNLWISTNEGLSKFDPVKERFRNYDSRDGFQSNEFNNWAYLKLKSGELVFGGINGFNVFNPREIRDNFFVPPVVISDFSIFNKPVPIGEKDSPLRRSITLEEEITLSYRDSVFSFEFAALDYNIPGKNQYAYLMEGFDKEWIYCGNRRFATYTNLDPGEYVFRIRGTNNDGIWNEEGKALRIRITPPFWKTWWFRTLGAMAIAWTAGSIYQNKLNQIRKEKKAQEEFTKRLIDVQEADRKRIANDLHDSIGHNLLITKNKLLLSAKKPDDSEFLMNNIGEVSDLISTTLKDIREISYTLRPYQIERLGLAKAIKSILDRASKSTEINFVSNIDEIEKLMPLDVELSLFRIVQECINNIVKHSQAKEVILNISRGKDDISILISDDGKGFSMEKVRTSPDKHGFGLTGMSERIKLFRGKFMIESSPGNGTSIKINVPY